MVTRQRRVTMSLILLLVASAQAAAGARTASFGVSAQVVARASIEAVDEPATVELTSTDLAQGYKDLDAHYRVHTTGTTRYLLSIAPRTGVADRVHIDGLGAPVTLGLTDITVLQQATTTITELRLRLRLELRQGLTAGHYAMPVRLVVLAS